MHILVVNSGSSSIKFQLLDMTTEKPLASGLLEAIGSPSATLQIKINLLDEAGLPLPHLTHPEPVEGPVGEGAKQPGTSFAQQTQVTAQDHAQGLRLILTALEQAGIKQPDAIGHRVVHGGEHFQTPVLIDEAVMDTIRSVASLAPLHNPANLLGIEACRQHFPGLSQVAVFDTAFHQTMPETAWRYAVPDAWYQEHGVRRYGFHGSSHAFVSKVAAKWLGKPLQSCNLISLHLGNGASITAIEQGRSVDTSMGMTPLEGLVMGSRSGDLDPAIPAYLGRVAGLDAKTIEHQLNQQSGLKALCGDNDMRRILARADQGDTKASLALDIFVRRIRKYLGSYMLLLGRVDAIIFTGGIGENAAEIRARICQGLEPYGIWLNLEKNQADWQALAALHQSDKAGQEPALLVIATNEELEIARQVVAICQPR